MAKNNDSATPGQEGVISIIGPGMKVTGDCVSEGTLRIEGTVEGTVQAGKAVVVGKEGVVDGDIMTQDAVIGGRVTGSLVAESRLELQATCVIEGQVQARRIKLEEGGKVNGMVKIGEVSGQPAARKTLSGGGSGVREVSSVTEEPGSEAGSGGEGGEGGEGGDAGSGENRGHGDGQDRSGAS